MKIALFGGTGRVGSIVHSNAQFTHEVIRLTRQPINHGRIDKGLDIVGNVLNKEDIFHTLKGCDAVISCLNTDKNDVLSRSMPLILEGMRTHNIKRIITCGTAGILDARKDSNQYRFQTNESKRRSTTAAEDHLRAYLMLEASKLDWTIVCPTYLPEGERLGHFRTEKNVLPDGGKSISIFDTGDFILNQLEDRHYLRSRVGICY
ncbi:NAD(P)-dependent oxidoreductase [Rossellomorea aquimaris]|uniref:NAD(P)-dependent oxidoreductase n=1 Tax=Rossellomorea aquimaris TaxID=189382 RepID=UPI0007D06C7F|nr:NAD(P)H-binding protein [Rossellomorea aquimaris]